MNSILKTGLMTSVALCMGASYANAETLLAGNENGIHDHHNHHHHQTNHVHDGPPAPANIMGDHLHDKGEWMLSYDFMRMEMKDNRDGTDGLSPSDISGVVANRFFGMTGQPSTMRIVPTEMTMDMHMLGAMYGLSDDVTLMAMVNYKKNSMDHITFAAGNPAQELGTFTTRTNGFGDTKLAGLFKVYERPGHQVNFRAGLSLPTGSIDETDDILTPMNMRSTVRVPYAMQLGSGTYDLEPGLTYSGYSGNWGWGAQGLAELHLGRNDEDYSLGDKYKLNTWLAYGFTSKLTGSLSLAGEYESKIDGIDSQIVGPVQTADPDNYGGRRVEVGAGVNYVADSGFLKGSEFGAQVMLPVYQNLNGPQLERDYTFTLGYRKTF